MPLDPPFHFQQRCRANDLLRSFSFRRCLPHHRCPCLPAAVVTGDCGGWGMHGPAVHVRTLFWPKPIQHSPLWLLGLRRGGLERVCVGSSQHTLPSTDPHTQTRHDMRQCGGDGQTRLPAAAPCRRRTRRSPAARAAAHRLPAGVHARMCVLGEERVIRRGRGVSTHMICLPP